MDNPPDAEEILPGQIVSRETGELLRAYEAELRLWQSRINLIGPSTVGQIWERHVLDCAQLQPLLDPLLSSSPQPASRSRPLRLIDLGSGAGLPGLVLAILYRAHPGLEIELVESNQKKSAFLRVVAQKLDLSVKIQTERIEALEAGSADMIVSRALSPLPTLLTYAARFQSETTVCFFHKGQDVDGELTAAAKYWKFRSETIQSKIDPKSVILRIDQFERHPDHAREKGPGDV